MTPAITLVMSVVCLTLFQSTESLRQSLLAKKAAPANYIFLDNLLFESEPASVVDCASSCWKRPDCWSFTVTTTSLGTTCRGHAVWMTSAGERILTATTSLWHLNWLERACSNNTECGVPLSECFDGKCLCSPGYYYSNSKESCVEGCEEADLQTTVVAYPGYSIGWHNIICTKMSREDCITVCGQHAGVRTCDYLPYTPYHVLSCCLQAVTKLDVPSQWLVNPTSIHHQRTCV